MSTTDTGRAVELVMNARTCQALCEMAGVSSEFGAASMIVALSKARADNTCAGAYRVPCGPAALTFIRSEAPHIARLWPGVFGDVDVPRTHMLVVLAAAVGQCVTGVEFDGEGGFRLVFESGDGLVVGADGGLDWVAA